MTRHLLALALALCCLSASAEDELPKELPPDLEAAALRSAEATGLAIYRHDQAASVATDAALQLPQFRAEKRVTGWVTEERQGQIVVTFVDATPAALYRIRVINGVAGPVEALAAPAALSAYETGAAKARAAATAAKFQACSERYNSVVLPSGDQWAVYLIPGTTKSNVVPIGGTHRLQVGDAGVVSQRAFTRSCIALESPPEAVALTINHLLDAVPTEAHVFWNLWARKPIYVSTPPNGTVWAVEGGKIKLVERKTAKT